MILKCDTENRNAVSQEYSSAQYVRMYILIKLHMQTFLQQLL